MRYVAEHLHGICFAAVDSPASLIGCCTSMLAVTAMTLAHLYTLHAKDSTALGHVVVLHALAERDGGSSHRVLWHACWQGRSLRRCPTTYQKRTWLPAISCERLPLSVSCVLFVPSPRTLLVEDATASLTPLGTNILRLPYSVNNQLRAHEDCLNSHSSSDGTTT